MKKNKNKNIIKHFQEINKGLHDAILKLLEDHAMNHKKFIRISRSSNENIFILLISFTFLLIHDKHFLC